MKKLGILFSFFCLFSCTPNFWSEEISDQIVDQTTVETVAPPAEASLLYTEEGILIPDFIPALQPFVNEGCNTAWNNLSAIINTDGTLTYFIGLPDYTEDPLDYDKGRFTFIYQVRNPWYGQFQEEDPYTMLQVNWYTLPIDDYGSLTCEGLQEIRIWVLDELTNKWYMNSQVCWAAVLCNGQSPCNQGWTFDQIEYTPYESGYIHLVEGSIVNV
jgi:hypothetical protein